ncbi:hypothetical protein BJ944DRAFT_236121 [Cunninghamella echinulata]|nr:hypothetical protein BJ944DRAFT_236121 [Cunninghamella echinulata]
MSTETLNATIQKLLDEGNQDFINKKYESSSNKFGEACKQLDILNGELDPKNGDAYLLYGRALLEYAIQQTSVLGQSAKASAEAVEKQKEESEAPNTELNNSRFHFDDQPVFTSNNTEELNDKSTTDRDNEDDDDEDEEEENDGAQDDDFETAWDVLDVARVIFEKNDDDATKLKLAEVLLLLGDISLETEKFSAALPDFRKAIDIKESILKPDDRQLAEAHYKYALALELSSDSVEEALQELKKASTVLKARIQTLESGDANENDGGKGKGKPVLSEDAKKEIAEIQELVTDMEEKITELSVRQKDEEQASEMLKKVLGGLTGQPTDLPTTKKPDLNTATVNDLSTLVKRKVKEIVDNNKVNEDASKKQKSD